MASITASASGCFRDTLEAWPDLLAGGALGNALDRWRQGAVTDFIDLHYQGWHWPTFNGADIAISAGVGLMLLAALPSAQPAPKPRT
ncbi:signal peptidase II [Bosea sp. 2YAB26]|uniref:signal peptidase II n=1 Tax=Bosea sp. 2YAB26 TaxID=3237478 RepID=UPI003F9014D3